MFNVAKRWLNALVDPLSLIEPVYNPDPPKPALYGSDPQLGPVLYRAIIEENINEVRRILESPQRPCVEDVKSSKSNPYKYNILLHSYEPKFLRKPSPETQAAIMKLLLKSYDSDISLNDKARAFIYNSGKSHLIKVLLDHCESDITPQDKIKLFHDACRNHSLKTVELLLNYCKNVISPMEIGKGLLIASKSTSQAGRDLFIDRESAANTSKLLFDNYQDVISTDHKFESLENAISPPIRPDMHDVQLPLVISLLNDKEVMHKIIYTPNAIHSLLAYLNCAKIKEYECIQCFTQYNEIRLYSLENMDTFPNLKEAALTVQMNCGRRMKSSATVYCPSNPLDKQAKIKFPETKKEQPESDKKNILSI